MSETPTRTANSQTYQCWCLLVSSTTELTCGGFTSGPDDPFCATCTDRHPDAHDRFTVTQRDPRVSTDE